MHIQTSISYSCRTPLSAYRCPGCATRLPCPSKNLPPRTICGMRRNTRPTADTGFKYSTLLAVPCSGVITVTAVQATVQQRWRQIQATTRLGPEKPWLRSLGMLLF
jgi:hypothetical protein